MFLPENMYQYTWIVAPAVSIAVVLIVALIANLIVFPSIVGNALVKAIVYALIFFVLKMAYLMYRVWPVYLKQTTAPNVTDFVVRRAPDIVPLVGISATFLLIVALIANALAHRDRSRNVWAAAIVFAVAYGALIYGAYTNSLVNALVEIYF